MNFFDRFSKNTQIPNFMKTTSIYQTTNTHIISHKTLLKCELNCEYCDITLAWNNKAPWWWSDKIETCRSVLKVFYMKLYLHSLVDKLKWFYKNARCYNKNYLCQYLTNLMHKICFTISFISCLYMFRAHVLETCKGMK